MRFNGLDLNLLVALDALLREQNVTAAARSLNLSQPAMSAAVARLREYFCDEIFIMQGRQMIFTPLGESLAAPTQDILLRVKLTLGPRAAFDPATATRNFRIVVSDYLSIVFFSHIINQARTVAPGITFELLPFDDNPDGLLRNGEVDFLLFPEIYLTDDHPKVPLFEERLVCVACPSNAMIGDHLCFDDYMSMGHVAAQFGQTRKPAIEEWLLLKHGLKRRVQVAVQSFSVIPHVVMGSNLIATMHSRLADHYARRYPLRVMPLPLPLPSFVEALQWPALSQNDPASLWLRERILAEAKGMTTDSWGERGE